MTNSADEYKSRCTGLQIDRATEKTIAALRSVTIGEETAEVISVPYGAITGTLSNQEDLKQAFDGKQDTLTAGSNITITEDTISAIDTTYTAGTGISINANNVISATSSAPSWGIINGSLNNQLDLKSALDNCQQVLYSRYTISTYSSTNTYIKLATFTLNNSGNNGISNLFWVEAIGTSSKNYALVKLGASWGGTGYGNTKFEILEKYGTDTSCFDSLVWAYNHTPLEGGTANIVGEVWMQIRPVSSWTYYFRPTQCNEYGSSLDSTITRGDNYYSYYRYTGTSVEVASTNITSGYTQVLVIDNSSSTNYSFRDLSNLTTVGEKHFINKTQITNCILEDPKVIDVSLSIGTLTLKENSIIIVPNGFESDGTTPKFTKVTIENDLTLADTYTYSGTVSIQVLNGNALSSERIDRCFSGAIVPTFPTGELYATWYDTTSNLVKRSEDGGSTWTSGYSLPICLCNYTNAFTSLSQTFQSIGYLGSYVFVRDGLKFLIPDGRNEDGSLKNTGVTTSNVITRYMSGTLDTMGFLSSNNISSTHLSNYYYDEKSNFNYNGTSVLNAIPIFTATLNSGTISNFKPAQPINIFKSTDALTKQNILTQTSRNVTANIALDNMCNLYVITPTGATTLTFSGAKVGLVYTFELKIVMSTVYSLTFPGGVKWMDDITPDLSTAGVYYLVFRTEDGGSTWLGNSQGYWSLT